MSDIENSTKEIYGITHTINNRYIRFFKVNLKVTHVITCNVFIFI